MISLKLVKKLKPIKIYVTNDSILKSLSKFEELLQSIYSLFAKFCLLRKIILRKFLWNFLK